MRHRFYLIALISAAVLGWVENSHGRIEAHDHGDGGDIALHTFPNGYATTLSKVPPDVQFPGLIRVKMSSQKGVQIGPHHFRPKRGDLRFSLIKGVPEVWLRELERSDKKAPEPRFYYHVVERDGERTKESLVDAVTGELIDPQTGRPMESAIPVP